MNCNYCEKRQHICLGTIGDHDIRQCFRDRRKATETPNPISSTLACSIAKVDDLAMLVRRLVSALNKHDPKSELVDKAIDYMTRNGLNGSPLKQ